MITEQQAVNTTQQCPTNFHAPVQGFDDCPEYGLAMAVLAQGIQDALHPTNQRLQRDGWDWINCSSGERFSFCYCCSLSGLDPDALRWKMRTQGERIRKAMAGAHLSSSVRRVD